VREAIENGGGDLVRAPAASERNKQDGDRGSDLFKDGLIAKSLTSTCARMLATADLDWCRAQRGLAQAKGTRTISEARPTCSAPPTMTRVSD